MHLMLCQLRSNPGIDRMIGFSPIRKLGHCRPLNRLKRPPVPSSSYFRGRFIQIQFPALRPGRALLNPLSQDLLFFFRQRLRHAFGRRWHFFIQHTLQQQTGISVARHGGLTGIPAFQESFPTFKRQTAGRLRALVALQAACGQNPGNLIFKQISRVS